MADSFEQKRHASVCPVCCGKCQVPYGFYNNCDYYTTYTTTSGAVECRSCFGTGVVWSPSSMDEFSNKFDKESKFNG